MHETHGSDSIDVILRDAPAMLGDEFVVCRGKIHQAPCEDEYLLQTDPSSWDKIVYLKKADIVGDPRRISEDDLDATEVGFAIHELRVRKGALAKHYRVRTYRVGFEGSTPPQEDAPEPGQPGATQNIRDILAAAPGAMGEEYLVVRGAIIQSPWPQSLIFQPDPSSKRDWALIRLDQLVGSDAIEQVPESGLAPHERGHRIYRLRIRHGEEIRVFLGRTIAVGVPFLSEDGPTHGGGRPGSTGDVVSEAEDDVTTTPAATGSGDCGCAQKTGKCGGTIKGSGWPCAAPGTFCRCYGIRPHSGACTTVKHWWWGCVCDCV